MWLIPIALLGVRSGALLSQATPVLVKDLNVGPVAAAPVTAGAHGVIGSELYFAEYWSLEFWKTDGSESGTRLLRDIYPAGRLSAPGPVVALDGSRGLFPASGVEGRELWLTDGTNSGTRLVKDINPGGFGAASSNPTNLTNAGGIVYFGADDGVHGSELWKSDGTDAGTALVKDIAPGSTSANSSFLTPLGTRLLFFTAIGYSTPDWSMWITDGTDGGTIPLGSLVPSAVLVWSGRAYLSATDGTNSGLFVTDGTPGGTVFLKRGVPRGMAGLGSFVYFGADGPGSSNTLWKTDGTVAGTTPLTTLPGPPSMGAEALAVGASLFFAAPGAQMEGLELWKTDGTPGGTSRVKDIAPGLAGSNPARLTAFGDSLLFFADATGAGAYQMFTSDGTDPGTIPLTSFASPPDGVEPYGPGITVAGAFAFFTASVRQNLWQTDGTAAGTHVTKILPSSTYHASPFPLGDLGGRLLFTADVSQFGTRTLFSTDGTDVGTKALTCDGCANNGGIASFKGRAYFASSDPAGDTELWSTDGTSEGTALLKDLWPGRSSSPDGFLVAGSNLLFSASGPAGVELWKSDGTADGTALVKDIKPGAGSSSPTSLTALGCPVVFFADDGVHGAELWVSDGTETGTSLVKDIRPGAASSAVGGPIFRLGSQVFFAANDGTSGTELWKSDGTPSGTIQVKDLAIGAPGSVPFGFCELDGALFFFARAASGSWGLWRSNGSDAGTQLVSAITSDGAQQPEPHDLVAMKGRLFFGANDGIAGDELWTSDGTGPGTHLLVDIQPGRASSLPLYLINVDGILYFAADDGIHGQELWQSDGTAAGTRLVGEVSAGSAESSVGAPLASAGRLYFSALEPTVGQELWSIPLPPVNGLFNVVMPCRVFDTRDPAGPAGGPSLRVGVPRSFPVAGTCGIPADARAIVGNLTAVNGTALGDLRVGASDEGRTGAAALPFPPGRARANNVAVKLGTTGAISVELASPVCGAQGDAILDVSGYYR